MAQNILEEANDIIHGARNAQYGHPLENHGLTAKFWVIYLEELTRQGRPVQAEDVCFLNILQKISRSLNNVDQKRDTLVDIAGYAGNVEMIQDKRKGKSNAKG